MVVSHKIRLCRMSHKKENFLRKCYGASRYAYNQAKELSDAHYKEIGKSLSKQALRNKFVQEVKQLPENEWMFSVPKSVLEEAVFDYHTALVRMFKGRSRFPKFKSKHSSRNSFTLNNSQFSVQGKFLKIAKFNETFKLAEPLRFEGKVLRATVSEKNGKHYISVTVEVDKSPLPQTGAMVGIDLNLHSIDASDGTSFPHLQYLKRSQHHLAQLQRSLSRKKKGSKNYNKMRLRVAKCNERISNQRLDAHHKLSHALVRDNSFVFMEDLNVRGMLKNKRLAKAIQDASFYQFTNMVEYKSRNNARIFKKVGKFFPSSKTCSNCGQARTKLDLSERIFECPSCGMLIGRDYNAAINIRNEGERLLKLTNPTEGFSAVTPVERLSDSKSSLEDVEQIAMKQEPIIIPD